MLYYIGTVNSYVSSCFFCLLEAADMKGFTHVSFKLRHQVYFTDSGGWRAV